jgi:predicted nucleotide-binding protein
MPQINQALLDKLTAKLGVTRARVYARIQQIANSKMLDRHHAALVLAAENNISIQKYSSPQDRAAIRGTLNSIDNGVTESAPPHVDAPTKGGLRKRKPVKQSRTRDNSVFVVHGRDEGLRKSMFDFLRAMGLNPMEWSKAVLLPKTGGANPHVDDILDSAMARVQAVVVIFSPDDLAMLKESLLAKGEKSTEGKLQGQPRPNVIFEAGLALGRHPDKTLLVQIGSVRGFSDIAGKHLVRLTNDVAKRKDVANRLGKIGCKVDLDGDDWMTAGNFIPKPRV